MTRPGRILVTRIRRIFTGDLDRPVAEGENLLIENGVFSEIGTGVTDADAVLDAKGLDLWPGLVDAHVHPIVGDVSVMPHGAGWIGEYMNGGVTSMISAGELTTPGLKELTPEIVVDLACVTARLYRGAQMGPKVYAGTLLLVPGLERSDFERVAAAGGVCVKYIYYPFAEPDPHELDNYRSWAHDAGLKVKLHCGGTSYRGGSVTADRAVFEAAAPDIAGHLNGGPIPVTDDDARFIVAESGAAFEIIMGGNLRLARDIVGWAESAGVLGNLLCGTDTPGGSGITPRAMLQLVAFLAGTCKLPPGDAVAAVSGNVTRAHGIEAGTVAVGRPADFLLVGAVRGSSARTAEASVAAGEIPGIGAVVVDGEVKAIPGRLTPPPTELPQITEVG